MENCFFWSRERRKVLLEKSSDMEIKRPERAAFKLPHDRHREDTQVLNDGDANEGQAPALPRELNGKAVGNNFSWGDAIWQRTIRRAGFKKTTLSYLDSLWLSSGYLCGDSRLSI